MTRRPRAALSLAPTYNEISDTQDAYLTSGKLRLLAKQNARHWRFNDVPSTVALPGNRYAKSLNGFTSHQTEPLFRELLGEYAEHGVLRPGGYADVFHEKFTSPHVCYSVNSLLAPAFAGGWQDALAIGFHAGTYYKYDMRSAYLWAATLGMPEPSSYTRSLAPWKGKHDGLYRIKLLRPSPGAPFPFNRATECLATNTEIELYNLQISEVVTGVVWKSTIDPQRIVDAITCVSAWKQAARAYWGRWAQTEKVECYANGKTWKLPNRALNIPWAHTIVSRVKQRLWECSTDAVHVFVDSVITPHQLPIGPNVGDWKLEKVYTRGVVVGAAGRYGEPDAKLWDRAAGIPINSAARALTA